MDRDDPLVQLRVQSQLLALAHDPFMLEMLDLVFLELDDGVGGRLGVDHGNKFRKVAFERIEEVFGELEFGEEFCADFFDNLFIILADGEMVEFFINFFATKVQISYQRVLEGQLRRR